MKDNFVQLKIRNVVVYYDIIQNKRIQFYEFYKNLLFNETNIDSLKCIKENTTSNEIENKIRNKEKIKILNNKLMNHLKNKLKSRWYEMKMVFSVLRGLDE